MIKNPLVSIIMPLHGRPEFVEEAIESVVNQTYSNIELILVDDNGVDTKAQVETQNKLSRFVGGRVRYIPNKVNIGVSSTRNKGAHESSGEYITFLDDDDVYYSYKIEAQLKEMQERCLDVSVCSFDRFDSEGEVEYRSAIQPKLECVQDFLFKKASPHAPAIMFKRDAFFDAGGFDVNLSYREDRMLVASALVKGWRLGSVGKPLFSYRVHSGFRLSKKKFSSKEINEIYEVVERKEGELKGHLSPKEIEKLELVSLYKKLRLLYNSECRIPFGLMSRVLILSVKNKKTKTALRGVLRFFKAMTYS